MRSDNAQPFELVDLCLGVAAQGAQDFTIVLTKRRRCTSQPPIHARITKRRSRSRVRSDDGVRERFVETARLKLRILCGAPRVRNGRGRNPCLEERFRKFDR